MPKITDDPNHPNVKRGPADTAPVPQHDTYLVLSEEERQKGFIRPYRDAYQHVGAPSNILLLCEGKSASDYCAHCGADLCVLAAGVYERGCPVRNRMSGCGVETRMGVHIAETYARDPSFYGQTYCVGCYMHRPVAEFRWTVDGTVVGS